MSISFDYTLIKVHRDHPVRIVWADESHIDIEHSYLGTCVIGEVRYFERVLDGARWILGSGLDRQYDDSTCVHICLMGEGEMRLLLLMKGCTDQIIDRITLKRRY